MADKETLQIEGQTDFKFTVSAVLDGSTTKKLLQVTYAPTQTDERVPWASLVKPEEKEANEEQPIEEKQTEEQVNPILEAPEVEKTNNLKEQTPIMLVDNSNYQLVPPF